MALRLVNKINRNIIQNFSKTIYNTQIETITTTTVCNNINEEARAKNVNVKKNRVYPPSTNIQSGMPPIKNIPKNQISSEMSAKQIYTPMQNLQPSSMPKYYKNDMDLQHATFPKQSAMESSDSTKYRQFEKSTTYKSVKLPLKATRLAGPFPDPVKVMPSDTTSDQEKAEQKTAEARLSNPRTVNSMQQRSYSSFGGTVFPDDKKCRKNPEKKQCPNLKGPCDPPKAKNCDRDYIYKKCKKKEAPYPAYSEYCHTVPDEKPSECKLCPWKPSDHPTFKPPKKKFHTSCVTYCPRKRAQQKCQRKTDWAEEKLKNETPLKSSAENEDLPTPLAPEFVTLHLEEKMPCDKPIFNRCPPGTTKKDKRKKKGKKAKKGKKSKRKAGKGKTTGEGTKKTPKKKAISLNSNRSWITLVDVESIRQLPNVFDNKPYLLAGKKKGKGKNKNDSRTVGKGKCKKIPRGSPYKSQLIGGVTKCPRPKKKKLVVDCPEERSRCKDTAPLNPASFEYLLDGKKKDAYEQEIPRANVERCKVEEEPPCHPPKRGGTKRCPSDLLVKRRRKVKRPPPKKSEGLTTPQIIPSNGNTPSVSCEKNNQMN